MTERAQDDGGQCVVSEEILRYAQDDRESVQNDILHRLSLISTATLICCQSGADVALSQQLTYLPALP